MDTFWGAFGELSEENSSDTVPNSSMIVSFHKKKGEMKKERKKNESIPLFLFKFSDKPILDYC